MENGDLGDIGRNLILLAPIILFIVFNVFFRRRRRERTPPEIVFSLLSDVAFNQQSVEASLQGGQVKKFKTDSWQRNRGKLEFLDQQLQENLAKTFSMVEEFNRAIDAARAYKSSSYLEGIGIDKLKELLAWSRRRLEEWLQSSSGQAQVPTGRRGLFS